MAESLALEDLTEEKRPWRQYISLRCAGKAAAGESGRRAVRAGHFLARDDDWFLCFCLRKGRMINSEKDQRCARDHREPRSPNSARKGYIPHRSRHYYKIVMIGKMNF